MSKAYVEASKRKEDLSSSSFSFFFVGLILIVGDVLVYFDIIPIATDSISAKIFYMTIITLIAVIFFIIGIISSKKAKKLDSESNNEVRLTEEIIEYCLKNFNEPVDDESLEEQDLFFIRDSYLRDLISAQYKGLSESYLDFVTETVYDEIYSKKNE